MKKHSWFSKWFMLPVIMVAMVLALAAGFTMAYFNDSETSNSNNATAWSSAVWTQTSQAHFDAGVKNNVNTTYSVDNVILSAGSGAGANMILFWDGGTAPSGWNIVSDKSNEPFYQVLPRGAATYGGTGGTATHTHTVSLVSHDVASATTAVSGSGTNRSAPTHTHTLASGSTDAVSNLPSYRNLQVIQYSGVPTTIPMGAIAIFDTTPNPAYWTQYSAQDNYFVRSDATAGGTGGSNTETHTVTISLGAATGNQAVSTTSPRTAVATNTHTHGASNGTTTSTDKQPPYITVILAKANSATAIPYGMIAMFDATPTGDWSVVSGSSQPFDSKFIVGSPIYGNTGGAGTHTPVNLAITSATVTGTGNASTSSPTASVASDTHTHSVTVSFGSSSNLPPYIDVIFAKALYASSGTIASEVKPTVSGSRWDGLVWDNVPLPSGTSITFEVRASDTVFAKDAGSPSWTSVGGTSPVISGLPAGQYKQWRATLFADGTRTSTPTLQEVRVYYYGN